MATSTAVHPVPLGLENPGRYLIPDNAAGGGGKDMKSWCGDGVTWLDHRKEGVTRAESGPLFGD